MTFHEKTVKSEIIYKGQILNLRRDEVIVNDGSHSYREIIEHSGGALAVALTEDNQVVMVRQFRKPMERDMLELPAGKIDPGEDPLETVKRELREETGYTAGEVTYMGKFYPSVGYTNEALYIYLAKDLTLGERDLDPHEVVDVELIDLDKAVEMVVKGEITDGKSMVGLLLTKYHL